MGQYKRQAVFRFHCLQQPFKHYNQTIGQRKSVHVFCFTGADGDRVRDVSTLRQGINHILQRG
nr:hypothetical protein [Schmidingerella arcuata]